MPSMRSTRPVKGIQGSDCQTVQHIIIGPGALWVIGQDVLEAAFFLLAVRSLGKCRLLRGGKMGLGLSNGNDAIACGQHFDGRSRGCLMDFS